MSRRGYWTIYDDVETTMREIDGIEWVDRRGQRLFEGLTSEQVQSQYIDPILRGIKKTKKKKVIDHFEQESDLFEV